MQRSQINIIAEMLTDHPDVFSEEASGLGSSGMAGNISKPAQSPTTRSADSPTTDPNVKETPLNATEIQKQAADTTGNDASADLMANQMKVQQDMKKQEQVERERVMKPQFDKLNSTMAGLQQGVMQGKQAATAGGEQFGALEKEMTSLNTLLSGIQKQI